MTLLRLLTAAAWRTAAALRRATTDALTTIAARAALVMLLPTVVSCSIEPPLNLPDSDEMVEIELPLVEVQIDVVWDINVDWRTYWWYGWDELDEDLFGPLDYPEPTYYEVRRYYEGEQSSEKHDYVDGFTVYGNMFRRTYAYGYHDLLVWSNIDSKDGTQVLIVNEEDKENITASTTKTHVMYQRTSSRTTPLKNQPEVFYSGYEKGVYISNDKKDYDYFDENEKAWVKKLKLPLGPKVYIYLVQVVIYNNNGKITGLADNSTMTNMAESVNVNTGYTSYHEADVVFEMRMKKDLQAREGRKADIMGGKFTTFGLCDMAPLEVSRSIQYAGSRKELVNDVQLNFSFNNSSDALFHYNVTDQLQRQAHGGIVTIEIDADTITVPTSGTTAGSGFNPLVDDPDSVTHEFGI